MNVGHKTSGKESPIIGDIEITNSLNNALFNEKIAQDKFFESYYFVSKDILLVSVSLFGILISLTDSSKDCYYARLFFVISLLLLALSIIMIGVSMIVRLRIDRYQLTKSYWKRLSIENQTKYHKPIFKYTKLSAWKALKFGILFFILSLIFLLIYIIIRNEIIC